MKTKKCNKCQKQQPLINFASNKTHRDGLKGICKRCSCKMSKSNYIKNRINILKQKRIYDQKHRKDKSDWRRKYRRLNWDSIINKERKYNRTHKKFLRLKNKRYLQTPLGIFKTLKKGAYVRGIDFKIQESTFINWYNKQDQRCYYCNRTLAQIKSDKKEIKRFRGRLSIDRKDNNKGYVKGNLTLACCRCNTIKAARFTEKQMLKIGKIIYEIK